MIRELFHNLKKRKQLVKAFRAAGLFKTVGSDERKIFPKIQGIRETKKHTKYIFTLITGMDPKLLQKNFYVFEQIFGKDVFLEGDVKTFVLNVKKPKDPSDDDTIPFNLDECREAIKKHRLGIICGYDQAGNLITYDMAKHPHLLIAGETGSGKSSEARVILTTLIATKKPSELQLYLGDCKRQEFHIFKKVEHVQYVHSKAKDIERMLLKVRAEMNARADLTEMYEVGHIDDLPKEHKKPYILVCIDEFVLLRGNETIDNILIDIVCAGRTLGVFAILSMQRPNAKTLDTTIRSQCTVSMGFQLRDKIEENMVNTPGASKLDEPGHFILNNKKIEKLQGPFIDIDPAKKLLNPFCVMKQPVKDVTPIPDNSKELTESDVYGDVNPKG